MSAAAPYLELVSNYLGGRISPDTFARSFHQLTMGDQIQDRDLYSTVMQIFFLADSYTTVPGLAEERPDDFITEPQLREGVAKWSPVLTKLGEKT